MTNFGYGRFTAAKLIASRVLGAGIKEVRNMPSGMGGCPVVAASGPTTCWPVVIDDVKIRALLLLRQPRGEIADYFVSDPKLASIVGEGTSIQTLLLIPAKVFHLPVVRLRPFQAAHAQFYLEESVTNVWVMKK